MPAIRAESLSKVYRINRAAPDDLRSLLSNLVRGPLHRLRHGASHSVETEEFWALRDVSFELAAGEILGVIGRNGSGKSTLLKVLSQITEPTRGRAEIRGRVGCLLEVGTGFHPELTGRENVYLNGAILGMTRREVKRKFAEIVEFSGVERFLDTPVKRYSTGMRVRLGFAVAAHLEPEILIVDEVLSVGDAVFQKRCLGKMQGIAGSGRTVLFVSHNLSSIRQLCTQCLLLENGRIVTRGVPDEVIDAYQQADGPRGSFDGWPPTAGCSIVAVQLIDPAGNAASIVPSGERLCVELTVANAGPESELALGFSLETHDLVRITSDCTRNRDQYFRCLTGSNRYACYLPSLPLNQGAYYVTLAIHDAKSGVTLDRRDQCIGFEVLGGRCAAGMRANHRTGILVVPHRWERLGS